MIDSIKNTFSGFSPDLGLKSSVYLGGACLGATVVAERILPFILVATICNMNEDDPEREDEVSSGSLSKVMLGSAAAIAAGGVIGGYISSLALKGIEKAAEALRK